MGLRFAERTGVLWGNSQVSLGQKRGTLTGWRFLVDRLKPHMESET